MYDVAVQKNGDLIRFVPEELQTEEMCLLALKTSVEGMAVTYIPQSVRRKEKPQNGMNSLYNIMG